MVDATIKLIIFGLLTCFLLVVSRTSLRHILSHGFYRFFAWEAMAALLLLNIDMWFSNPFSLLQIISWILLLVSLVLVANGVALIRSKGKPLEHRQDETLLAFEKTSTLVSSGIYKYIRHPLYSSLLFLAWGIFLKEISLPSICLTLLSTFCLVLTARADETECLHYFGPSYKEYMSHTKRFVPYIY
jgi:protein-S-isoprenylcysteine O-methyltransferase Ste14